MPTTRLSSRQLEVLRALAEPGARATYRISRWRLRGKTITQQIKLLRKAGLVDVVVDFQTTATINDAGRAVVGGQ